MVQLLSLYFISTFLGYGGGASVFSLSGEKLEKKLKDVFGKKISHCLLCLRYMKSFLDDSEGYFFCKFHQ